MAWKKIAFTDETLTNPATADLDMADYQILGVDDVQAFDATGIRFRDNGAVERIILADTTYAFDAKAIANMNGNRLVGVGAATNATDALPMNQAMLLDGTQAMTADLNMDQNAIKELAFENLASAPHAATEVQGEAYYNTADDHIHVWVV